MADIKQTQEAEHAKLVLDRISNLPVERDLLMAGAVYSREEYGGDCRHFTTLIDTDDLKALSARLTAMEEALVKARDAIKTQRECLIMDKMCLHCHEVTSDALSHINQVLEGK